jgi:hypothetical protein
MASRIGDSRSVSVLPFDLEALPSFSISFTACYSCDSSSLRFHTFCVLYRPFVASFVVFYELASIPISHPQSTSISPRDDNAMSSSIAIPKRKQPGSSSSGASSSSASPYPGWANSAASPSFSPSSLASTSASPSSASTPSSMARYAERRPSLLGMFEVTLLKYVVADECIGDSLSKSEYTVVNIGGPEHPRLVSTSR